MASVDAPLPPNLMTAFQSSVGKHFNSAAAAVGARLSALSPSLYGFATEHAVVTIGIYYGHFPGLCVKLRERGRHDTLGVDDKRDIGLANVVAFCDPSVRLDAHPETFWTEDSLDAELGKLADYLLRYGKIFLTDPTADWIGLRRLIQERFEKSLAERPWLRKFSRDT